MTLFEFLNENKAIIDTLVKQGVLPCTILNHIEIYTDVLKEQKNGSKKTDSYWEVADKRKIHYNTVLNAVVKMQATV